MAHLVEEVNARFNRPSVGTPWMSVACGTAYTDVGIDRRDRLRPPRRRRCPAPLPLAAAYERVSLGIASHWPFDQWGRFLPEQTTAVSLLDRLLHHSVVVLTDGESFRMREARQRGGGYTTRTSCSQCKG